MLYVTVLVSELEPRQPGGRAYVGKQCTFYLCQRWRAHPRSGPVSKATIPRESLSAL